METEVATQLLGRDLVIDEVYRGYPVILVSDTDFVKSLREERYGTPSLVKKWLDGITTTVSCQSMMNIYL